MHALALWLLPLLRIFPAKPADPILSSRVAGLPFPSPVGQAAGMDKNARAFRDMFLRGFGSVEVGTLTPKFQRGNSRPRIDRLEHDSAIINRMGFPNDGLQAALARLVSYPQRPGPLGVNIGANEDSPDKIDDYVVGYRSAAGVADYVTVNVSSPNTPGLRKLESGDALRSLLAALDPEIEELHTPVFLKVSPDLDDQQIAETSNYLLGSRIAAVIVGNTTMKRPTLKTPSVGDGGLSGLPLRPISESALEKFYAHLGNRLPIISVGGIFNAEDVFSRIRMGASLVQLYSAFTYEGPFLIDRMNRELAALLKTNGFSSLSAAIGSAAQLRFTLKKTVVTPEERPKIRVAQAVV